MNKREEEKLRRQEEKLEREKARIQAMSVYEEEYASCAYINNKDPAGHKFCFINKYLA